MFFKSGDKIKIKGRRGVYVTGPCTNDSVSVYDSTDTWIGWENIKNVMKILARPKPTREKVAEQCLTALLNDDVYKARCIAYDFANAEYESS